MSTFTDAARAPYTENKKLMVINFFGGPGTGKSTCAAALFALMKKNSLNAEFIHEVAKDLVWERLYHIFGEQDYIFGLQNRLLRRLVMHDIQFAVVDSSILLSLFYMPDDFPQSFRPFVVEAFNSYNNVNIFLTRNPNIPYIKEGRNETEEEAKGKDQAIKEYFLTNNVRHYDVEAGDSAPEEIFKIVRFRSEERTLSQAFSSVNK